MGQDKGPRERALWKHGAALAPQVHVRGSFSDLDAYPCVVVMCPCTKRLPGRRPASPQTAPGTATRWTGCTHCPAGCAHKVLLETTAPARRLPRSGASGDAVRCGGSRVMACGTVRCDASALATGPWLLGHGYWAMATGPWLLGLDLPRTIGGPRKG